MICQYTADLPDTRYCKADGTVKRDGVSLTVQISLPVSPRVALCGDIGDKVGKVTERGKIGEIRADFKRCRTSYQNGSFRDVSRSICYQEKESAP